MRALMKPIGIFRHSITDGAGYFAMFLDAHNVPWQLIKLDEGAAVPADPLAFSGLGFMGGPMSVNDNLPWIAPVLALIRCAVVADVPVIGHCLGGQLMARALGGVVSRNPVTEIGWGQVDVLPGDEARLWLGGAASFESFHWHSETFSIPPGATRIAYSRYCDNQLFSLGKHIGLQCHIEITPELIVAWIADWEKEIQSLVQHPASVQTPAQMLAHVEEKTAALHRVADGIYTQWVTTLAR
jgi:GMP synthase-like glutamine amidotransferase